MGPAQIRSQLKRSSAGAARARDQRVNVIFTCDLFNEGVDLPFVDTLLLLRPVQSACPPRALWLNCQAASGGLQIGRARRADAAALRTQGLGSVADRHLGEHHPIVAKAHAEQRRDVAVVDVAVVAATATVAHDAIAHVVEMSAFLQSRSGTMLGAIAGPESFLARIPSFGLSKQQ